MATISSTKLRRKVPGQIAKLSDLFIIILDLESLNSAITAIGDAPSSGSVTSVSVVSANGVSGSVANPTTTPAITLTLGAITPSSVNGNTITTGTGTLTLSTFTLTVAANSSISNSNTGDQTITLTGEATGSGTGSFAVTLTNASVIGKVLTGYVSGAGVVAATDTILQAIQKLNGNIGAIVSGVSSVNSLTGAVALTGTANRITISAANVFDIAATYVGQTSITTLGTISTGTWSATAIAASKGGTAIDTSASTGVAQIAAGTWSVSTAIVDGTTATTQAASDNSTKLATTAYADAKVADAINNGTTTIAPSQNAVFDALALKEDASYALQTVRMTGGNQSTTSDVAANVTDMVYALEASTTYVITGFYKTGCNNTGGIKLAYVVPAGASMYFGHQGTTTSNAAFQSLNSLVSGTLLSVAYNRENANPRTVFFTGTVTTAGTAGDLQLQLASGTNTQTSTLYADGTFWQIQKQ